MEKFDVVVVGGGIAGSIAARFAAKNGLKSLLIEKAKTPRDKACSGIQFSYFEKLVSGPIPKEKLCKNEITGVHIILPGDKIKTGKMRMLNFWRSTFDSWLNDMAIKEGAIFEDQTRMIDFKQSDEGILLQLQSGTEQREIFTHYLIASDGMSSKIRKKLHPEDYFQTAQGGTMNYYCTGEGNLDSSVMYMVNIKEYAPMMFAWTYKKDDLWVIGTGTENESVKDYADRFYDYICKKFNFAGNIVRKEAFTSALKSSVYLGDGNILICGDAAGLLDPYRGMGMDNAALSAMIAVEAILDAKKSGSKAIIFYEEKMEPIKKRLEANEIKRKAKFHSNETLAQSMTSGRILKGGIMLVAANFVNRFLPAKKIITLPF
ncbi:MAG: NAD(P)/FAD-dependent oxidoreductase [Actinomycetota bacterium]